MSPLDNIKVVLVGTLYTGNVGSACRAMANMGFHKLVLAAPNLQNSWDEGERMAVHATAILNGRQEFATFEEAVADCVAVVGTTARGGLYRQHVPRATARPTSSPSPPPAPSPSSSAARTRVSSTRKWPSARTSSASPWTKATPPSIFPRPF